jgi:hypothetical protein
MEWIFGSRILEQEIAAERNFPDPTQDAGKIYTTGTEVGQNFRGQFLFQMNRDQ